MSCRPYGWGDLQIAAKGSVTEPVHSPLLEVGPCGASRADAAGDAVACVAERSGDQDGPSAALAVLPMNSASQVRQSGRRLGGCFSAVANHVRTATATGSSDRSSETGLSLSETTLISKAAVTALALA